MSKILIVCCALSLGFGRLHADDVDLEKAVRSLVDAETDYAKLALEPATGRLLQVASS